MSELINRQMVIDALKKISFSRWFECGEYLSEDTREMKIISSNKALEVIEALPSVQPEPTQEIQNILDYLDTVLHPIVSPEHWDVYSKVHDMVSSLPSAQPDGIPLEWIDKHLEWLDNCDNDFAQLAKVSIKAMVELWKKDGI